MSSQRGFTLIELAIVLVIVTILIGGLSVPLSAQIQARRIAETKKTLEEAREAILGYAMTHAVDHDADPGTPPRPFLPCPDANGDGIEEARDAAGDCPQRAGWLPWVTLGTGSQDAWGNRLRYATHEDLTNSNNGFFDGSEAAPTSTWNHVCSLANCPTVDVAANVPVVVVSHGPNGWGARNINGNTLALPTSANEIENLDADHRYVSRIPSKPGDAAGEFDDLTVWLPFSVLINRVCPAGGCP